MPPYMRDNPASMTIASNSPRFSGKNVLNTSAPDDDTQLCPDGYDGWFGLPTEASTLMPPSAPHGRMYQYVSFESQQAITASNIVALANAYTCVASRSD